MTTPKDVADMIVQAGGTVESMTLLPDGHGVATASFPLPTDHWLYADDGFEAPPMTLRVGTSDPRRSEMEMKVKAAARYAVRAATMKGKEPDFDPDALVQNMIVGLLGYYTPDGTDHCEPWANPSPIPNHFK